MTARKEGQPIDRASATPAQETEADVLDEVGAEADENGELQASVEAVRKAGAVDAETVRQNRHTKSVAAKARKGEKISFSTDDPLVKYVGILEAWPASTIHIKVRRLSGGPEVTKVITSFPRSPSELFDEIKVAHGQCGEATYEVQFFDASTKAWRGKGKITLEDTRPPYQQGQPMTNPYYQPPPNGSPYQQPSGVAPAQPAPAPNPIEQFGQIFEMFRRFSGEMQQPQQAPPQQPPMMPPQPPPGADMATQMAWMRQVFDIFQRMQPAPAATPAPAQPQTQSASLPTTRPPPGMMWAWFPEFGSFALVPSPEAAAPRSPSGPMYRERSPYYPQGDQRGAPPWQQPQWQQPQRQQAPTDPFRDALSTVRSAMHLAEQFQEILPGRHERYDDPSPPVDDDSPVVVTKVGDIETIRNRDGTVRWGETLVANVPKGAKWLSEQMDKVNAERQKQQPRQRLPDGYVEVEEGYQPPPGFRAVRVDPSEVPRQEDLPPPPANIPPPIQPSAPQGRRWDAPTTPEEE